MALYEALYGQKCRSPVEWFEIDDRQFLGPNMIKDAVSKVELIRDCIKATQSRQKSYADNRHRELEFDVGDHVFMKVSPFKGVMRFGKRGKLSPRYIGTFEIFQRYGDVAYELALPLELAVVHSVFHVSMLRKYLLNDSHVLQSLAIEVDPRMTYVEEPIVILDRQI